jgi:hypothetical protein
MEITSWSGRRVDKNHHTAEHASRLVVLFGGFPHPPHTVCGLPVSDEIGQDDSPGSRDSRDMRGVLYVICGYGAGRPRSAQGSLGLVSVALVDLIPQSDMVWSRRPSCSYRARRACSSSMLARMPRPIGCRGWSDKGPSHTCTPTPTSAASPACPPFTLVHPRARLWRRRPYRRRLEKTCCRRFLSLAACRRPSSATFTRFCPPHTHSPVKHPLPRLGSSLGEGFLLPSRRRTRAEFGFGSDQSIHPRSHVAGSPKVPGPSQ